MRNKWMTLVFLFVMLVSTLLPGVASAASANKLDGATLATVQVVIVDEAGDSISAGSGSLVTTDGLVLTNYHVIAENPRADDRLLVRIPKSARGSDDQFFIGRTLAVDEDADLAVVQLIADDKGEPLANAQFPTIALGDSDALAVGDELYALGYPDIGPNQLVVTRGMVSGFLEDANNPWILSDVVISNGNSGGAAVNDKGELVAIPTQIRVGEQSAATMAYLRPINHARTLIDRARTQGRTVGRNNQNAAGEVVTLIGQEIVEIKRMTVNGKHTPDLEEVVNNLFVDAIWTLQPDNSFQFEAVNGDEPIVWEGQWEYNEQDKQAFLETEIFEATLFVEDDAWHLHIQLNTRVEDVGRIQAEFYQTVRSEEAQASAAAQNITLTIKNTTRTKICYVYISPASEGKWGEDWLGSEEMIRPRQQRQFEVAVGTYDLLVQDCDGNELGQVLEVELNEDSTWTVKN